MEMKYKVVSEREDDPVPLAAFSSSEDAVDYVIFRAFRSDDAIKNKMAIETLEATDEYGAMQIVARCIQSEMEDLEPSRSMQSLGERIRHVRLQRGMTQTQVADRLLKVGIKSANDSHFYLYERDRRTPSLSTLVGICAVLSISADYLLAID